MQHWAITAGISKPQISLYLIINCCMMQHLEIDTNSSQKILFVPEPSLQIAQKRAECWTGSSPHRGDKMIARGMEGSFFKSLSSKSGGSKQ
jgi:hypothetical protein